MASLPTRDFHFLPIPNAPTNPPPLTLSNSSTWTYCGPLLTLTTNSPPTTTTIPTPTATATATTADLPATFHTWSAQTLNRSLLPQLTPFLRAAHAFLAQHGVQHYWLTVRASQRQSAAAATTTTVTAPAATATATVFAAQPSSQPLQQQQQSRWHTAGDFFANPDLDDDSTPNDAVHRWKLYATLQGPGMRFAVDGVRARELLLRGSAEGGGGRSGGGGGVVPGTEAGFRRVLGRYGMEEFPRSWSVGLPGWGWLDAAAAGGEEEQAEGAEDEGVSMERY
ncbi:hypothetical protein F5144DRAFT_619456 [Chaetomium tenue]|uniref:Uncharacterized protein n=1 Tax=Chaetomium tenue TaxID=1854479 RepID=A0ACB7PCB8_9PEZI|nr:hypothetical protein F5144DRAFT_619456 [Chaetomium globosum]